MKRVSRNIVPMLEDDATAAADDAKKQKIERATEDKVQINAKIHEIRQRAEAEIAILNKQIDQKDKEIADNGGTNVAEKNESVKCRFSRHLFESLQENRTEEMTNAIKVACDNLPELSYRFDDTRCRTFSKRIIGYINGMELVAGGDNWDKVSEFITNMISNGYAPLSKREIGMFVSELKNVLQDNVMFNWIFGN